MPENERTLPDYKQPPVIETVLGVQFTPLTKFSIPHYGLYWAKIRDEYPNFEVQPPLGPVTEQFGPGQDSTTVSLEMALFPDARCWFIDSTGTRLIQLQKDRFIHNWRKTTENEVYPHYANIKPRFANEWVNFCRFVMDAGLSEPEVNQCEITYVNHIEMGQGWVSYQELNQVLSCWSGSRSGSFLPGPESVSISAKYVLPDKKGRLHISTQPAVRNKDAKEIIQLNLTARGKPDSNDLDQILDWFDLGHEWIVQGFTDFTNQEMHARWGRIA